MTKKKIAEMDKIKTGSEDATGRHKRAEEKFSADDAKDAKKLTPKETRQMLHELRVHKIELEMQNDELRRAQTELDAARVRYFDLYNLAPVGYVTISAKGLILEANLTAVTLLGVPRGALVKQPLSRFILKEDQDIYYLHHKKLLATAEAQACELRMVKKDGKVFYGRLAATLHQDACGDSICRMVISDISKRKLAERELQILSLRNQAMLEAIPDIIMEVDVNKVYTWANRSGIEFFGADVLGKEAAFFFEGEQEVYDKVQPLFQGVENIIYLESWQRRRDGEKRLLAWWCRVLKDVSGNVIGALSSARDITARKQLENEKENMYRTLREKNEELERFTYSVSHDLKSPLVTIRTFLGQLEKDMAAQDKEKIKEDIDYIGNGSEKMSSLLDELLNLSRIGRKPNPPEDISLQSLVQEASALVAGRLTEHNVEVNITKTELVLHGDRVRLVEVFQNLLDNACKFMGKQRSPLIKIGVETKDNETVIFVSDNGMGIDPKFLPKIFNVFEKLNAGIEGTGIGLALVKRIVEVHGGKIWVESAGPGQGATFRFTLPGKRSAFGVRSSE